MNFYELLLSTFLWISDIMWCVYINKYNDKFTRSGGGDELSDSSSPQTLQKMQEKERLVVVAQFIR